MQCGDENPFAGMVSPDATVIPKEPWGRGSRELKSRLSKVMWRDAPESISHPRGRFSDCEMLMAMVAVQAWCGQEPMSFSLLGVRRWIPYLEEGGAGAFQVSALLCGVVVSAA